MINQANKIQAFLLNNIEKHPNDIVSLAIAKFNVSRTTVLRHMGYLIKAGKVVKSGNTRQISYALADALNKQITIKLEPRFSETDAFVDYVEKTIRSYTNKAAYDICEYVVTEMLNNCKDHSRGSKVTLHTCITDDDVLIKIEDNGIGVFNSLQSVVATSDPREIMLELSKGKLTSDSENHTGEGIFFTSRACDVFSITANGYCYTRDNLEADWQFVEADYKAGTLIKLQIGRQTNTALVGIFERYQNLDNLEFATSEVIVELARLQGERLISRSQAKRIARNLEKFSKVLLDFKGVEAVGQGFVDELFRVFQRQHPGIALDYINANKNVEFMIKRGVATANARRKGNT